MPVSPLRQPDRKISQPKYRATIAGLPIGEGLLSAQIGEGRYSARVDGSISIPGISNGFDAKASGSLCETRLLPASFQAKTSGRENRTIAVTFAGDRAVRTIVTPEFSEAERQERIPLEPEHRIDVLDPLSAMLTQFLRASRGGNPCEGISRVFSGQSRFDVELGGGGSGSGEIICRATWRPIAGHKKPSSGSADPALVILVAFPTAAGGQGPRLRVRIEWPSAFGTIVIRRVV